MPEIDDEHGTIDARQKERIMKRREEVDEWEMELYTQALLGEIADEQADLLWGYRVRAYLKAVEPVLEYDATEDHQRGSPTPYSTDGGGDENLARRVYEQFPLGSVTVAPPPDVVEQSGGGRRDRRSGIVSGDLEPKTTTVTGIRSVIEQKTVEETWTVQIRDNDGRNRRREEVVRRSKPHPYHVLEDAVRVTDMWLQRVGIGIEFDDGLPAWGFEEADELPDEAEVL